MRVQERLRVRLTLWEKLREGLELGVGVGEGPVGVRVRERVGVGEAVQVGVLLALPVGE